MQFILNLLSAVALLAYGIYVTKTTVLRACGASLGAVLNRALDSRLRAAAVGLGTTMLVQSSTATSLLVSSFLKKGILSLGTALAIMLGADLGTAVMARILTYDLSVICPLLIIIGTVAFLTGGERPQLKRCGGIGLGLGLILLSLTLIVRTSRSVVDAQLTRLLLQSLTDQIAFSLLLGTVLAVLCYSSLAAVLLTAVLCAPGSMELESALAVVLGANFGSCLLEILGALRQGVTARRVMWGNTLFKAATGAVCLPWLGSLSALPASWGTAPADVVIWFHVAFNALVCVALLPCVQPCSRLLYWLFPEPQLPPDPNAPKHLDRNAYLDPKMALGNAVREILSLGDVLQQMVANVGAGLTQQPKPYADCRELKARIRGIAIQLSDYLSGINCDSAPQRRRLRQCLLLSVNLSESAQLMHNIDKKINKMNNGKLLVGFAHDERLKMLALSRSYGQTLAAAFTMLVTPEEEQRQTFKTCRTEFMHLVAGLLSGSLAVTSRDQASGSEQRFNVVMMEVLDHYRQLYGMCDAFLPVEGAGVAPPG